MSNYEPIVPENISSNSFEYHNVPMTVVSDSPGTYQGYYPAYLFFAKGQWGCTSTAAPPHFVGIKSDKTLICDRYDFTVRWDLVAMTVKDFIIESSMDGETWKELYTGTVPFVATYSQECEFEPTICKYIRMKILTTYDTRGYKWVQGTNFKVYGTLANIRHLYTNNSAYGIRRET